MSRDETSSSDVSGSDSRQEETDSYPFPLKNTPADEVEIESKRRGKSIYQNYEILGRILERHEETIQKRWLKKNRKQRLEVLLTAWPDMPPTHQPFYDLWRHVDTDPEVKVKQHSSILWPYINKESLGKPAPFLLLLNSRGRHPHPLFLDKDHQYFHKAIETEMVVKKPYPTEDMSMLLRGVPEDDYGTVKKFPEAAPGVWLHLSNKDYAWPTSTLYGKEWPVQERLMDFLVKCCYRILHEIEPHNLFSDVYPVQPEPELPSTTQTEGLQTSLLEITFEAPYRVPTRLNFANLEKLFAARAAAAEDHVWAMREDPNYFAEQISDMYDHVLLIGDTREHKSKWGAAIGEVLANAYTMIEVFTGAHRITKRLCQLQEKYASVVTPTEKLPDEYNNQIRHFLSFVLTVREVIFLPKLELLVKRSLPFRAAMNLWRFRPEDRDRPLTYNEQFWLKWVVGHLYDSRGMLDNENDVVPDIFAMNMVVDDLELQMERDKTIRDLLSPTAHAMMGDFTIIIQTLHALERFEPWNRGFGGEADDDSMDWSTDSIRARLSILEQIHEAFESTPAPALLPFVENKLGKFTYPEHRRRNKENVEMMRRAESNLDAFWARADRYLYDRTKNVNDSILMGLLKSPRVLQRTPEWAEPTKEKRKVLDIEQPLSTFFFGLSSDNRDTKASGRLSVKPPKAKLKTRGTATKSTETDEAPAEAMADVALEDPKPIFVVDRRALKTFRILFYDPDVTSTPGEVPWNDFLHALTSVGLAAEKLYGSVWQFSPYTLEANGSIHFHEPHPHNKVPFVIARRHGRRLHRTYGWTGEQFVLDKIVMC
ncbi:C2H2 C2HC zinc finger [Fusarium globosum]|uniref:C2H2 C2HC zinc finger n=1 Tax=Fusarium globosum TaxID=78864 RepID=A0A8H5XMB0_9HYPO|nr:C2H2 C2HC zinc finger [Fusarium globosum]